MTKKKDPSDLLPPGRPTMYKAVFCDQILEYFDVEPYREITRVNKKTGNEYTQQVANDLPTLAGFAKRIGVCRDTLHQWGKVHPAFSDAVMRAKTMAEHLLVTNGLLGLYNPAAFQFVAKNYTNLRDVKDLNVHEVAEPTPRSTQEIIDAIKRREEKIAMLEAQL